MFDDVLTSFQNGDPLVFVFNFPTGFWHLARINKIDKPRWVALSEIIYVLTRPKTQDWQMDYGTIIDPHLTSVRCVKEWTETFLQISRRDLLNGILKIQELQIASFQKQIALLKSQYTDETMRPSASQIYTFSKKINKIKRASGLLRSALDD